MYSTKETMKILGVNSRTTLYKWCNETGVTPSYDEKGWCVYSERDVKTLQEYVPYDRTHNLVCYTRKHDTKHDVTRKDVSSYIVCEGYGVLKDDVNKKVPMYLRPGFFSVKQLDKLKALCEKHDVTLHKL